MESMVNVLQADEDTVKGSDPDKTVQDCGGLVNAIGNLLVANAVSNQETKEVRLS